MWSEVAGPFTFFFAKTYGSIFLNDSTFFFAKGQENYSDPFVTFPFNYLNKADGIWSCQEAQRLMNLFSFPPGAASREGSTLVFLDF